MDNKGEFFFKEIGNNELTPSLKEQFEDYYQISEVVDIITINLDGEEGFILIAESINYQILFVDKEEGESSIMFKQLTLEEAKTKFNEIRCEYKKECY